MAKEKVSVDDLVKGAVLKLATGEGPMRLSGKGDHPPLFGSAAGPSKDAIAKLQAADNPLIHTVGTGKTTTVKLTAAGFALALPSIPEDKVGPLAKQFAAEIPSAAARVEFLQQIVGRTPLATAELLPVLEETRTAERAETEARLAASTKRREAEDAFRKAIEQWMKLLDGRQAERIAALRRELEIEGAKVPPTRAERPEQPDHEVSPQSDDDNAFRRQTARRLVSSWLQQWKLGRDQGREALEVAIGGMTGIRRVGTLGESVGFDGVVHECESAVSDGQAVTIVRAGWLLVEDDGPYTLAKALVE